MIGARIGTKIGPRVGPAVGVGADPIAAGGMAGVTRDATSGIYCPATAAEWTQTMAAAGLSSGNPSLLWKMGEASGNLADSLGSFTGTAAGTGLSYQQSASGWSRVGVSFTDAGTGNFSNAAAGLPDPASASQLAIAYGIVTTAAAERTVVIHAGTTRLNGNITATAGFHPKSSSTSSATGTSDAHNRVLPWTLKHNATGSEQKLYTDTEKVSPTFSALVGKKFQIGAGALACPGMTLLYVAVFINAAAELTDAQVKTLLQTLGWTITWS